MKKKLKDSFLKYWEVEELRTAKDAVKVSDFMYYIFLEMKCAPDTMRAEAAQKYGDKELTNKQWSDFAKGWMWCKYHRLERIVGSEKIQAAKDAGFISVSEFKQYGRYTKEVYITRKGVRLMADKFNFNPNQIGG